MGWTPEGGYHHLDWRGYNEAMLVYLLALGSPTHPIDASAWDAWTSTYTWGTLLVDGAGDVVDDAEALAQRGVIGGGAQGAFECGARVAGAAELLADEREVERDVDEGVAVFQREEPAVDGGGGVRPRAAAAPRSPSRARPWTQRASAAARCRRW